MAFAPMLPMSSDLADSDFAIATLPSGISDMFDSLARCGISIFGSGERNDNLSAGSVKVRNRQNDCFNKRDYE